MSDNDPATIGVVFLSGIFVPSRTKTGGIFMNNQDLEHIQQVIGYRFQNWDLLQQAFVRRSYSEENGGENNEVLEFIGDRVLDMIVVKLMIEEYGFMLRECDDYDESKEFDEFACDKTEAELTEIKKQLVQKKHLAHRIDRLDLADYLIVGKGDHTQNENSVKEDLFEAIIGAAAIDSNWNMEELQNLVETMLEPDSIIDDSQQNYIALIQDWTAKKGIGVPLYHFEPCGYSRTIIGCLYAFYPQAIEQRISLNDKLANESKFHCLLKIDNDFLPFRGYGRSKAEARYNACKTAYQYLEKEGLLFSIRDEIPNPTKEDAISQLEILSRRGYFPIPSYAFVERHDHDGNPIWQCSCMIKNCEYISKAVSSSKKGAKKQAAWEMLQHILDLKI